MESFDKVANVKCKTGQIKTFLFIACLASSCDQLVVFRFVVENETRSVVHCTFNTTYHAKSLALQPGQTAVLFERAEITGVREDFFGSSLYIFNNLQLSIDGVKSQRKITNREFWQLRWINADTAEYKLNISNTFF